MNRRFNVLDLLEIINSLIVGNSIILLLNECILLPHEIDTNFVQLQSFCYFEELWRFILQTLQTLHKLNLEGLLR